MADSLVVEIRTKVEQADPDGRQCVVCGDSCYLSMWEIAVYVDSKRQDGIVGVLCSSCRDILDSDGE